MSAKFKTGDQISWNSEAGHVCGRIIKIHRRDFDYKGYKHHASSDDLQYEIRSDKTEHIAVHMGSAFSKKQKAGLKTSTKTILQFVSKPDGN